ncbi:54S ribosomal protein IMG1 [Penicillium rolfsii]|nr:54S ribosomal protein IMG1 [Penicillium rolfsii]
MHQGAFHGVKAEREKKVKAEKSIAEQIRGLAEILPVGSIQNSTPTFLSSTQTITTMAALPTMRPLGCLRSLFKTQEVVKPQLGLRLLSTAYSQRPQRVPLPQSLPEQFLSQVPVRLRPENAPQPIKVYTPPPSTRKACKDPIAKVTEMQLENLDPKGERKALFDYRRNSRSIRPGDIVRVTFKNGDPFNGVVLSIKLRGIDTSFLLRNELTRVAVELSVKVFNPNVQSVEIVQRAQRKIRRARLYYMRFVIYPNTPESPSFVTTLLTAFLLHRSRKHDRRSVENVVNAYIRQKKAFMGGGKR